MGHSSPAPHVRRTTWVIFTGYERILCSFMVNTMMFVVKGAARVNWERVLLVIHTHRDASINIYNTPSKQKGQGEYVCGNVHCQ